MNAYKTNYIAFSLLNRTQPNTNFNIRVHHCSNTEREVGCDCPLIGKVNAVKYLGVMLDQNLSWQPHIELVSSRLRKLMWIFRALRYVASKPLLNQIYIALAQSISIYCITVWGGAAKTKMIDVERAQRALLKVAYFKKRRFPTTSLYALADTLSIRRLFLLHTILRKHTQVEYHPPRCDKRRNHNVAKIVQTRTQFAQSQLQYLSSYLYNKSNKILQIYSLPLRECKSKVTAWLKTLDYDETELLLKHVT